MAASHEAHDLPLEDILSKNDLKREDLNTECPRNIMYDIAIKIKDWKTVGHFLSIPGEKLAAIEEDNQKAEQRRVALLITWHECHGKNATCLMLMIALHKVNRRDLIDRLCALLKSHTVARGVQHLPNEPGSSNAVSIKMGTLEGRFTELRHQLKSDLSKKQVSVEAVLDTLTSLPVNLNLEYDELIQDRLVSVAESTTISQLFLRLNPLTTFIDYRLLSYLVSKFGSNQLKAEMASYEHDVQIFMRETTIRDLMPHWPGKRLRSADFSELWIKIGENPDTYTLEELNKFRDKHSATIKLSAVLSSLKSLLPGQSFFAVWQIPTVAVKDVTEGIAHTDHTFYKKEHVQMIILDNKLLYISHEQDALTDPGLTTSDLLSQHKEPSDKPGLLMADRVSELVGKRYRFESKNYPSHFIRHQNWKIFKHPHKPTQLYKSDSSFDVIPGLCGQGITLRSVNYPAYYVRHYKRKGECFIHSADGKRSFLEDASFIPRPGLADPKGVSFESVNFPGQFLRHYCDRVRKDINDNTPLFLDDATWYPRLTRIEANDRAEKEKEAKKRIKAVKEKSVDVPKGNIARRIVKSVYDLFKKPSNSEKEDSDTSSSESDDAPKAKRQKMA